MCPKMKLEHYVAVPVIVGVIVIISKCYPNVSGMMIGRSLSKSTDYQMWTSKLLTQSLWCYLHSLNWQKNGLSAGELFASHLLPLLYVCL